MVVSSAEAVARRFHVSRESQRRLREYVDLLMKWQQRINLIGHANENEIWQRHVADGLQLLPLISADVQTALDLGSGGGIPGMVVAIAAMDRQPVSVHLVESTGKKAAFLRQSAMVTGAPAEVHQCRIEALANAPGITSVDLVMARALAPLPKLLDLAYPWLRRGAYGLFHKGQDVDGELTESAKSWRIALAKHPSLTDSRGCILEVKEIEHVRS